MTGITGYKIRRTHYGHPVRDAGRASNGKVYADDFRRDGYDIATVDANTTSYVAAVTDHGEGFPAVVTVKAHLLIAYGGVGAATTGPGKCKDHHMRW